MVVRNNEHFLKVVLILLISLAGYSIGLAQDATLIAKSTFPSVVMLEMRDDKNRPISLGSGFFVRPDVVVTNYHVIEGASEGFAKIVGKTAIYHIEGVVGIDKTKDLALLKLTGVMGKPLVLADISKVEVGQEVFAFGNPKGLEGTISTGIISGSSLRKVGNENLIQITAPISPGSSGGPVVNKKGEVIGVAVASLKDGQNLNFVVPASYLAILLATSRGITSLTSVMTPPLETAITNAEPSLTETTNWIRSKLEGSQYVTQFANIKEPSLRTLKSLRFSGCEMNIEEISQTGRFSTTDSMRASLTWVTMVYSMPGVDTENEVILSLDRAVPDNLLFFDGQSTVVQMHSTSFVVADLQMSERVVKAFKRAVKLCKEETKKEPF